MFEVKLERDGVRLTVHRPSIRQRLYRDSLRAYLPDNADPVEAYYFVRCLAYTDVDGDLGLPPIVDKKTDTPACFEAWAALDGGDDALCGEWLIAIDQVEAPLAGKNGAPGETLTDAEKKATSKTA